MLLVNVPVVVSLIIALVSPASGNLVKETNGQRMARGLSPLPPKFGRAIPGKVQTGAPTPAWGAKRTYTSPTPIISYSGRIQARNEDGSALGIVRNSNSSWTIGGLNFLGPEQELHVGFKVPALGKAPFNILATNPLFPEPYYVGVSGTQFVNSIAADNRNTLAFTNVQKTPENSVPVKSTFGDLTTTVESAIWSIDSQTKELTAQYVNPDKSTPTTVIAYDIRENKLFFVGNITAYNENNDTPASAIHLYLVPL